MRLTLTLAGSIFVGLCIVLVANVYVGIRLQRDAFLNDASRDHRLLTASMASVLTAGGQIQAQAAAEMINGHSEDLEVRWVDIDLPSTDPRGPRAAIDGEALAKDTYASALLFDSAGHTTLHSYETIRIGERVYGTLEVSESVRRSDFVSRLTAFTLATGVFMAVISALLALYLGRRWVSAPVQRLISSTRRLAAGDFSIPEEPGIGEIAQLGQALHQMGRELQRATEQLRHADRLNTVGKLSSGVAHELGTPLHVVLGRAKAIVNDVETTEHNRENAETIVRQANRMSDIIRQLLSFAHAKNIRKRTTNLIGIMDEAVAMVKHMATKKQLTIVVPTGRDVPIVRVDPTQMQQVLANLLINAIQASDDEATVTMSLSTAKAQRLGNGHGELTEYIVCSITDEGEGIDDEALPHVFEPFFTTKEVGKGTGLGLSVAMGIVREHGGWIDVDTRAGAGSCFNLYLPVS